MFEHALPSALSFLTVNFGSFNEILMSVRQIIYILRTYLSYVLYILQHVVLTIFLGPVLTHLSLLLVMFTATSSFFPFPVCLFLKLLLHDLWTLTVCFLLLFYFSAFLVVLL